MGKFLVIPRLRAMGDSVGNIVFSRKRSATTVKTVVDRSMAWSLEWPLPEEMN